MCENAPRAVELKKLGIWLLSSHTSAKYYNFANVRAYG